jgi:hypothetical protein
MGGAAFNGSKFTGRFGMFYGRTRAYIHKTAAGPGAGRDGRLFWILRSRDCRGRLRYATRIEGSRILLLSGL